MRSFRLITRGFSLGWGKHNYSKRACLWEALWAGRIYSKLSLVLTCVGLPPQLVSPCETMLSGYRPWPHTRLGGWLRSHALTRLHQKIPRTKLASDKMKTQISYHSFMSVTKRNASHIYPFIYFQLPLFSLYISNNQNIKQNSVKVSLRDTVSQSNIFSDM